MALTKSSSIEDLCINTIRGLAMDATQKANSGHPGLPMGAATIGHVLFTRHLRFNPKNPKWPNRDRFVLSAGHGCLLQYILLYLTGYDLTLEDLKRFRQWGSKTPGHPEYGVTPGVEVTTGPLGQGFGNAVGMAIAEAWLGARYNRPGYNIIDHYTYVLASDGDMMEGVASEAASLAGHLKLSKLIVLYDSNHISLDGPTVMAFTEEVGKRFEAYGWFVQHIDGMDINEVDQAISRAKEQKDMPSLIVCRTHIGYGSPNKQDTAAAHGSPLGAEEVILAKQNLGIPTDKEFYVPDEVLEEYRKAVPRGRLLEDEWRSLYEQWKNEFPELAKEFEMAQEGQLPEGWDSDIPWIPEDSDGMATRNASRTAVNYFAGKIPWLLGGSADLASSTYTDIKGEKEFQAGSYDGRILRFGVREHAMGAALNGMYLHGGVRPFGGTFLVFSDYMRPSIRLAALMEISPIYVFSHDSVGLGEDGPTHQPVEHYAALRAIPNLLFIRPADANETLAAWRFALTQRHRPVALALTRQKVRILPGTKDKAKEGVEKGAYILLDAQGTPDIILIATGSEVQLCVAAKKELERVGIKTRVVSMPCERLFLEQGKDYIEHVLPKAVRKRLAVESGVSFGWERWVGDQGDVLSIERFGASAPYERIFKEFGFTIDNVINKAIKVLWQG